MRFSYSSLSLFEACPRRWYEQYVEGRKSPATEATALGNVVHAAIERFLPVVHRGAKVKRGDAEAAVIRLMAEAPVPVPRTPAVAMAWGALKAPLPKGRPTVEETLHAMHQGSEFTGRADAVIEEGDGITLVDWKTGRRTYGAGETHQLGLYTWMMGQKTRKPVRARLIFLRTGEAPEIEGTEEVQAGARDWAMSLVEDIGRRLKRGKTAFPAMPGHHCGTCHVASTCPLLQAANPVEAMKAMGEAFDSELAAARAAQMILVLDAWRASLQASLKTYVDEVGPVQVGDEVFDCSYGQVPTVTTDDMGSFVRLLRPEDSIGKLLRADAKGLERFLREASGDHPARRFVSTKRNKRFGHERARDEESEGHKQGLEVWNRHTTTVSLGAKVSAERSGPTPTVRR